VLTDWTNRLEEHLTNGLYDFEDHLPRMNPLDTARLTNLVCLFDVGTTLITSRCQISRSMSPAVQ
jgi:hypothetical protein